MKVLEAAVEVLRRAGRPLHLSEITRLILKKGHCRLGGRRPQDTVGARIYKRPRSTPIVQVAEATFEWEARPANEGNRESGGEAPSGTAGKQDHNIESIKKMVRGSAGDLKRALDSLWPTKDGRAEPERNLMFWVARRLARKGLLPLFEVNFLGSNSNRLDLVAVRRGGGTAEVWLCEGKNLWDGNDAAKAAKDFHRLQKFGLRKHDLPKSRVRCLVLLSTWRKSVRDWWKDPSRTNRLPGKRAHPGWGKLRRQLSRRRVSFDAVRGGQFKEDGGGKTTRWVLIATWKRPAR